MKYFIRIICLPFWLIVGFIHMFFVLMNKCRLFVLYGGECITYLPEDRATISSIYEELKLNKQNIS